MRAILLALLATALPASLSAQTIIAGSVSDGAGGPLLAGTVYHASGNITVPLGLTLTIQAGAVIKFGVNTFTVHGTLNSQGTAGSPVILTTIHDDAAGGDTNGNGNATTPQPNNWYGLNMVSTSGASVLKYTRIRYTGAGGWPAVTLSSADVTMTDCAISDAGRGGLKLNTVARPTVTRCDFQRIASSPAIYGGSIETLPGFTDNTVASNSGGNYLRVDSGIVGVSMSIAPNNYPGGALVVRANTSVAAGVTLTLKAGVIFKPSSANTVTINGTLKTQGTALNPVIFTSFHDDAAGGDTNGNGSASTAKINQWYGLLFNNLADASSLTHTTVRYTGAGGWAAIRLSSADVTVTDCEFTDCGRGGMSVNTVARPTVTRCNFSRVNASPAIYGGTILGLPKFLDNTASNNPGGNFLRIDSASVTANMAISTNNYFNGALVIRGNLSVSTGVTLTVNDGVVLKPQSANTVTINGTLNCVGTASRPVIFTSYKDDSAGGDTNGDAAATVPAASNWYGLLFNQNSGASLLDYVEVRYTGAGGWAAVRSASADISISNSIIAHAGRGGLSVNSVARPTVSNCNFDDVKVLPVVLGASINAVPGFTNCRASNSPGLEYIRVSSATVSGNIVIKTENCIGPVLVISGNTSIPQNAGLTLEAGVIIKQRSASTTTVNGRLDVFGPVVFTSLKDDGYGGDTNGDGSATSAAASQWYGLRFNATATGRLDLALIRLCGSGGWPAVYCDSASVIFSRSRAEFSGRGGFDLGAAAAAVDLVAFANTTFGFRLRSGSFNLARATSAFNSTNGVEGVVAWTGQVLSSIAFGNPGSGFSGLLAGQVSYSNGSGIGGGVGNRNVDPQFVSAAAGDLRLLSTSVCIDAGDPSDTPQGLDPLGVPRFLDGNLGGSQRVDMGANEFTNIRLTVGGTSTPGGSLTITSAARPSISLAVLVLGLDSPFGLPVFNFGNLFINLAGPIDLITMPVNGSVALPLPAGITTPLRVGFQLVGLGAPFPRGNTSNLVPVTIK